MFIDLYDMLEFMRKWSSFYGYYSTELSGVVIVWTIILYDHAKANQCTCGSIYM